MEELSIFISLLGILFFIPKLINKFDIPEQITEILLGLLLGPFFFGIFHKNSLIEVMGTIGIITVFFVAGFSIDIKNIAKKRKTLLENGILHIILIIVLGGIIMGTGKSIITSILISIALLTPSAGFILSTIKSFQFSSYVVEWIETKVVSAEILSLLLLLVITNLNQPLLLLLLICGLLIICFLLPYFLEFFFLHILGKTNMHADTFFIFVIAVLFAFATHIIGVHYIIGAFIVGIIMRGATDSPSNKISLNEERVMATFSSFSSIFVPFYFFSVGLLISREMVSFKNIFIALVIFCLVISLKIILSFFHRRLTLHESFRASVMIALFTAPTLLFTFVTAEILYVSKQISAATYGILVIYGLLTASIPIIAGMLEKWFKRERRA